jgi:hypothetical protein
VKELTLDRSPMGISYVGKPLLMPVTFESLKNFTLERKLMDVSNVEKVFTCPTTLK